MARWCSRLERDSCPQRSSASLAEGDTPADSAASLPLPAAARALLPVSETSILRAGFFRRFSFFGALEAPSSSTGWRVEGLGSLRGSALPAAPFPGSSRRGSWKWRCPARPANIFSSPSPLARSPWPRKSSPRETSTDMDRSRRARGEGSCTGSRAERPKSELSSDWDKSNSEDDDPMRAILWCPEDWESAMASLRHRLFMPDMTAKW
mmetsp:Transcript_25206/g.73648  ORF Transcript_25206/g.73648 Transcript_25206/m.73648 type:complete len:208 (-) Transcript_25206:841-1464(-)